VFMGSSRFEGGVRPAILEPLLRQYTRQAPRTFNAAVGAGDPIVAERLLERMLSTGRRPTLLVLEISPEQLNRRSPLVEQQVIRQMTWTDLPRYLSDAYQYTRVMRLLSSRLLPMYIHRYQIRKQTLGRIPDALTGSGPQPFPPVPPADPLPQPNLHDLPPAEPIPVGLPAEASFEPGLAPMMKWLREYELSPVVTSALERLLLRCNTERIDVLLVGVFTMKGHRELITPKIEATYRAYVHSLSEKYGCRFVDYRDRVPDLGFGDPLHVNDVGGDYFSRILAREALIPLWRELHRPAPLPAPPDAVAGPGRVPP
jgi:hypothetical protein